MREKRTSPLLIHRYAPIMHGGAVQATGITSANIVGYSAVSDDGNYNPGIGSVFMPVGLGDTYLLGSIKVTGAADDEFMVPGTEYLQELNPNGSAVVGRYTYVSEAYLKDEYEDEWEDYKHLIGWWDRGFVGVSGHNRDNKEVDVGTAFLGFLNGNSLKFTSSGEVPTVSTQISDNGNYNPFFLNYLPVQITLGQITVEGAADDEFMVPGTEYLQVLNPNGSAVTARYTYVSVAYLKDEYEDEWEDYVELVGWWDRGYVGQDGHKRDSVTLDPGFSFLGFLNGNGLKFNFPAAATNN